MVLSMATMTKIQMIGKELKDVSCGKCPFTVYTTDWSDERARPSESPVQKAPTRIFWICGMKTIIPLSPWLPAKWATP